MSDDDGGGSEVHRSGFDRRASGLQRTQAHGPVARQHELYGGDAIDKMVRVEPRI